MAGRSEDPAVGKFLEFQVAPARPGAYDTSMNPEDYVEGKKTMIPLPVITPAELAAAPRRHFEYGRSNGTDDKPWTLKMDEGIGLRRRRATEAHLGRGRKRARWKSGHSKDGGRRDGRTRVHVHFAEGQILSRDGRAPPIWEKWARKDMYNIGRAHEQGLSRSPCVSRILSGVTSSIATTRPTKITRC